MNVTVERNSPSDPVKLVLWLDGDEARRVLDTLRELLGDARPKAKPESWTPLSQRSPAEAPKPPSAVMAEIRRTLRGPRKRA